MKHLQVPGGDVVLSNEWFLSTDNFIDARIGGENGLNGIECDDGAVSSSSAIRDR